MEKIKNYNVYTTAMAKTMLDKIWFLDKIPSTINTIVDFGCADGTLIQFIENLFPNHYNYIGIDNDETMREIAKKNLRSIGDKVHIVNSLSDISKEIASNSVLVLNSVIHEILSYCSFVECQTIWEQINSLNFAYVAIRDMHYQENVEEEKTDWLKARFYNRGYHFDEWLGKHYYNDFDNNRIIEYLLKYRYRENWSREVCERYLWDWKVILMTNLTKYTPIIETNFFVPFIFEQFEKDYMKMPFNPFNTHKKMLFKLL
jgi:SAM-dependent methyltransferase